MSLVFIHTADWQLGKPFASIRDEAKRNQVQQERLHAVQRLAAVVTDSGAAFVLVAGDLFDSSQATKSTVSANGQLGSRGSVGSARNNAFPNTRTMPRILFVLGGGSGT